MYKNIKFPMIYPVACHTDNVGAGTIFVAIKGMRQDGSEYIAKAIDLGASAIVIQDNLILANQVQEKIDNNGVKVLRVENPRKELAILSSAALGHPSKKLKIIAITGTKGKSTTSNLLYHVFSGIGLKTALLSTTGNKILSQEFSAPLTTPQPDYLHVFFDLCVQNGVEWVIMEVAAQAFSLYRAHALCFDAGIITNFSKEHGEFYNSQDEYFNAKKLILQHLKPQAPLFLNGDDKFVSKLKDVYTPSFLFAQLSDYELKFKLLGSSINGVSGMFYYKNHEYNISLPQLIGEFNLYNSAAAFLCCAQLGFDPNSVLNALSNFDGVKGRLNKMRLPNGATAFIDHAHNPSSFEAVLSTLRPLTDNLIAVFGAGGDRDASRRPIMGGIADQYADRIILTTDNPRSEDPNTIIKEILVGIRNSNKVVIEPDREKAIYKSYEMSKQNAIIVLMGKGCDEYQIVNNTKTYFSERNILNNLVN